MFLQRRSSRYLVNEIIVLEKDPLGKIGLVYGIIDGVAKIEYTVAGDSSCEAL